MTKPTDPHGPVTWPTGNDFLVTVYRGTTAAGVKPKHYWHVTSTVNGKVVADSGQGYTRRRAAIRAARRLWPVAS